MTKKGRLDKAPYAVAAHRRAWAGPLAQSGKSEQERDMSKAINGSVFIPDSSGWRMISPKRRRKIMQYDGRQPRAMPSQKYRQKID
jgi:hypothetical protein